MDNLQFLSLLKLPKPKVKNIPKNQEVKSFHTAIQKLSFPKVSDSDYKKITTQIANGEQLGQVIVSNIKEIDFNPTLTKECFEYIYSSQTFFSDEATFYLIHSIFSWLFFSTMAQKQNTYNLVLASAAVLKKKIEGAEIVIFYSYVLNHTIHLFQNFKITPIIKSMNVFFDQPGPYDSKIFDILFDIFLKKSKFDSETFTNSTLLFLKFFRKIIPQDPSLITPTVTNTLFNRLELYLSEFNADVFLFFRHVLPCTKSDDIFTFFTKVFKRFEAKIESSDQIFDLRQAFDKSETNKAIKVTLPANPQLVFRIDHSKSSTSASLISDFSIPTIQPEIHSKFESYIKALTVVSKTKETQMVIEQNFITLIQSKLESPYLFDYIYTIMSILFSYEASNIISKIVEIILQTKLFDQTITIFNSNYGQNYTLIAIRATAYYVLLQNFSDCFTLFINSYMEYPHVISELLIFMIKFTDYINVKAVEQPSFINNLQKIAMNYSTLMHDISNESNNNIIRQLIEYFALFLSRIFFKKEIVEILFQSDNFISMFFSFTYQPFSRRYIIKGFEYAIISFNTSIPEQAIIHILSILEASKYGETEDDYIIVYDLLILVNSLMGARTEMLECFVKVLEIICFIMYHLQHYDITEKLLQESIKFYKLYDDIQFDSVKCLSFVNGIKTLYGDEPSELVYNQLISLMTHDTTFINQQYVSILILESFCNSTRSVQYLAFILELCKFSQQNTITLHNGRFDLKLLELMNVKKTSKGQLEKDFIQQGLKLIEKIAATVSSTPVVKQFIKLLCPIKTKFISFYHSDFLITLQSIINQKKLNPTRALPLAQSSAFISVNELKPTLLQKGFEMTFWLFTESADKNVNLLNLSTKEKRDIVVSIKHRKLVVTMNGLKGRSSIYCFDVSIKAYEWFFISINIIKKNEQINVTGYFNETKQPTITGQWDSWQFVKCEIGRNTEETGYQLGSFGIFTTPNTESLYSKGPTVIHSNSLFYITCDIINEYLTPNCTSSYSITAEFIGPPIIQRVTFTDALVKLCTIDSLLPLYAQLDLPYEENVQTPSSMAVLVTSIFSKLLPISHDIQNEFASSEYFAIIQSLLCSLERSDFLTYELYMEFYIIFNSLTVKKLKSQLFGKVLMGFQLWSRASPKEALRIVKHWEHQLFQEYMPNSAKIFTFDKMLYFLCKFFPYNQDLDVVAIRQIIMKILLYISTTEFFRHSDIEYLIGQCIIQKKDAKMRTSHICDLISLIQMIVVTPGKPLEKFPDLWKDFAELQQLLNTADEDTIIFTINLFSVLHENSLFNCITLEQQMNVYLPFFATEFSQNFFNQIVVKASSNYGFFPLAFYIAYINSTVHDMIMSLLKPRSDIVSSVESLFWYFACIFKYDNKFGDFLIKFIYKCKILPIKTIMVISDVVGSILSEIEQSDLVKIRFLRYIASIIQAGEFEDNHSTFFEVSLQILLFKKLGYSSLPKKELNEIYGVEFQEHKKVDFIDIVKTKSLVKYLKEIENKEITFVFGVGVEYSEEAQKYQVRDRSLAQLTINLIVASNATDFYNEAAILCYFIHDKDKYGFFINSVYVAPEIIDCLTASNDKENLNQIDSNNWYSIISRQFAKINEDYSQFIAKYLQLFCKVFDEIDGNTKKLFTATKTDISCATLHQNELFDSKLDSNNHNTLKSWYHIWDRMTFDRSPWEDARTEQSSQHYKRDMFLCLNMFPSKLKLNINFDDHRLATLMQEVGDMSMAKKILDKEKEIEEKKKMEKVELEGTSTLLQMPNDITVEVNRLSTSSLEEQEKSNIDTVPVESYKAIQYKLEKEKKMKFNVFNNKIVLDFIEYDESITIESAKVSHILMRGINHLPRGLEIFQKNGPSFLIIFNREEKNVFEILKMISSLKGWSNTLIETVPHKKFFKNLGIKEKWENGLLSNFEYLLALNSYSGRSFNDPSMYPVFPWIIADYKSQTLDLKNEKSFRDLSKPVGALNPERLEKIKKRPNPYDCFVREPYLYPSSYSSLLYVYLFLIRMEPFTSLHIKAQSGKFDHAPRQFISIIKAYDMVNENIQDFRELTPEFFFDHSFLNNINNFNFGKFEGVPIGDVELPVWAHGSSIEFIYMNRKALESQYVSQNLNQWIDLIWGVKQNGPGAVESDNTFIPYMYESVWSDELIDQPGMAKGAEAYLQSCGQIPSQLFFSPHEIKKQPEFPTFLTNSREQLNIGIDNICCTFITESTFNQTKLICMNTKGNVYTAILAFQEGQPISISLKQWKGSFHDFDSGMIAKVNSSTLAAGTSVGKVELINSKSTEPITFSRHLGKITCVTADELYLVTGGSDTATNIFISNYSSSSSSSSSPSNSSSPNLTLTKSSSLYGNLATGFNFSFFHFFPSFRDDVSCCAVNSHFDLIVSGTLDSSLFFFSPTHKDVTRIIDLKGRIPEKVLITEGWGFVVVYELSLEKGNEFQCIEVYNVNGDFITSKLLQFQLQQWTTWKSVDGFDYLLMMSKGGIVFTCEVFYLDIIKAIKERVELKVLSMSYSYELGIIFVGLNDGTVQMIQFRYGQRI